MTVFAIICIALFVLGIGMYVGDLWLEHKLTEAQWYPTSAEREAAWDEHVYSAPGLSEALDDLAVSETPLFDDVALRRLRRQLEDDERADWPEVGRG